MNAMNIAPGDDDDRIEAEVSKAIKAINGEDKPTEAEPPKEDPATNLNLIKRTRRALVNNIEDVARNIASLNDRIADAARLREAQIRQVHEDHRQWLDNAKAELRQLNRVREVMEMAVSGLTTE